MERELLCSVEPAQSLRPFKRTTLGLAIFGAVLAAADSRPERLNITDSRDLLATDPAAVHQLLDTGRPPAVSPEARAFILKSLPHEGEIVVLGASRREKLAGLSPVLRALHREGVYEIKVVDVPQAAVGIYARAVVLISEPAFDLLNQEELTAAVAHEAGHEYVWGEWERATRLRDREALKRIELICDGLAVFTLHRLGMDPSALMSGFEKLARFNRNRLGKTGNEENIQVSRSGVALQRTSGAGSRDGQAVLT